MPQKTAPFLKTIFQVLVSKLPLSPSVFTESKIASYYENNAVPKNFEFSTFTDVS